MATIGWKNRKNLVRSVKNHLASQASGLTIFNDKTGEQSSLDIRMGYRNKDDWNLPVIAVYSETKDAPRGTIGNNTRFISYLIIIDIHALSDGMREDIAEWVQETMNEGFDFYSYSPNPADPDNLNSTLLGKASVEFLSDTVVRLGEGENVSEFDKYRHRITINVDISIKT